MSRRIAVRPRDFVCVLDVCSLFLGSNWTCPIRRKTRKLWMLRYGFGSGLDFLFFSLDVNGPAEKEMINIRYNGYFIITAGLGLGAEYELF